MGTAGRGPTTTIGAGVTVLATAAMAVDHLMGDDPGLEDPVTFVVSVALCLATAAFLFGWFVPRTLSGRRESAAGRGLWTSIVALVAVPLSIWLGLPFVVAGAGLALGLDGRHGESRRRAMVAVALGALVIALGTVVYLVQLVGKL